MRTVIVNGDGLTVQDVVDVARGRGPRRARPGRARRGWSPAARSWPPPIAGDDPVYGVNTGFGALADTRVGEQDLRRLQGAIVRSHAAGTGEPLDDPTVRALLLLRARTLAAGYSGVRSDLPQRLLELLDLGLLPVIPGQGLGRRLRRPGPARAPGAAADRRRTAARAGRRAAGPAGRGSAGRARDRRRWSSAPKEGLSLVNGTEPMQAVLAFSVHDAELLVKAADVACALSVEALLGHRPALRRAGAGAAAPSRPAGQRGQPARAAAPGRR